MDSRQKMFREKMFFCANGYWDFSEDKPEFHESIDDGLVTGACGPDRATDLVYVVYSENDTKVQKFREYMAHLFVSENEREYVLDTLAHDILSPMTGDGRLVFFMNRRGSSGVSTFLKLIQKVCGTYFISHDTDRQTILEDKKITMDGIVISGLDESLKRRRVIGHSEIYCSGSQADDPLSTRDAQMLIDASRVLQATYYVIVNSSQAIDPHNHQLWEHITLFDFQSHFAAQPVTSERGACNFWANKKLSSCGDTLSQYASVMLWDLIQRYLRNGEKHISVPMSFTVALKTMRTEGTRHAVERPPRLPSNFDKVIDFNRKFGVLTDIPNPATVLTESPSLAPTAFKLIHEEVGELKAAMDASDILEMADALGDILYVVYGMGCRLGLDLDRIFSIIHDNNMSKLCNSEDEAQRTVEWYRQRHAEMMASTASSGTTGTPTANVYDSPAYRDVGDGKFAVYNQSTRKILKSIEWKPVDLSDCITHGLAETITA